MIFRDVVGNIVEGGEVSNCVIIWYLRIYVNLFFFIRCVWLLSWIRV